MPNMFELFSERVKKIPFQNHDAIPHPDGWAPCLLPRRTIG
jgi:hypothetical protein